MCLLRKIVLFHPGYYTTKETGYSKCQLPCKMRGNEADFIETGIIGVVDGTDYAVNGTPPDSAAG